jgi:hypothetical protein
LCLAAVLAALPLARRAERAIAVEAAARPSLAAFTTRPKRATFAIRGAWAERATFAALGARPERARAGAFRPGPVRPSLAAFAAWTEGATFAALGARPEWPRLSIGRPRPERPRRIAIARPVEALARRPLFAGGGLGARPALPAVGSFRPVAPAGRSAAERALALGPATRAARPVTVRARPERTRRVAPWRAIALTAPVTRPFSISAPMARPFGLAALATRAFAGILSPPRRGSAVAAAARFRPLKTATAALIGAAGPAFLGAAVGVRRAFFVFVHHGRRLTGRVLEGEPIRRHGSPA